MTKFSKYGYKEVVYYVKKGVLHHEVCSGFRDVAELLSREKVKKYYSCTQEATGRSSWFYYDFTYTIHHTCEVMTEDSLPAEIKLAHLLFYL